MNTKTITIIETYYDEKRDLVQWLVHDLVGDDKPGARFTLCWPGKDLGPAVGVDAQLTPDLIRHFNKEIKGKTINIQMHADVKEMDVKAFKEMTEEEMVQEHDKIDKYPFFEVLDKLEEEGEFKDSTHKSKKTNRGYSTLLDFIKHED